MKGVWEDRNVKMRDVVEMEGKCDQKSGNIDNI
jgi:hypothetical protein